MKQEFLAFLFIYFFTYKTYSSGLPEQLKTGSNVLRETVSELARRASQLSPDKKIALHMAQLKEILPDILFAFLPYEQLKQINFSVQDDDIERAKKYERLGLFLLNNSFLDERGLKEEQISCCFQQSFLHLQRIEPYLAAENNNTDYYLSTAQLAYWAAIAYSKDATKDSASIISLLNNSLYFLRKSTEEINSFPSGDEVDEAEQIASFVIHSSLNKLPRKRLTELALDETTKLSLLDYQENPTYYENYIEKKAELARKKLMNSRFLELHSELLEKVDDVIENYKKILRQKILNEQKTPNQKIETIIKQDKHPLLLRLIEMQVLAEETLAQLEEKKVLVRLSLKEQFSFLGSDFGPTKEILVRKALKIYGAVTKELEKFSPQEEEREKTSLE